MDRKLSYRIALISALGVCTVAFVSGFIISKELAVKFMDIGRNYLSKIHFSFAGIFINNLTAASIIFLGAILFCLPSLISVSMNFMLIGVTLRLFGPEKGPLYFIVSLLPHGIFEIPAIILSLVLSFHTAGLFIRKFILAEDIILSSELKSTALIFIKVVIPLLLVAALVETSVTPLLMRLLK